MKNPEALSPEVAKYLNITATSFTFNNQKIDKSKLVGKLTASVKSID